MCTWSRGYVPGLGGMGGVPAQGGTWCGGVPGLGGVVPGPGGGVVYLVPGIPAQVLPPPLDRQTRVKTY